MPYKDPEKQRKFQRERIAEIRAEWFKDKICRKCGSKEDIQLNHIDRKDKISHKIWSWKKEKRDEELKKCEVLCKKCHRELHADEFRIETPHGTHSGYAYHGCRCNLCTNAQRKYIQWWKSQGAHPV